MTFLDKLKIRVPQLYRKFLRIARSRILIWTKQSDVKRWSSASHLQPNWDERTKIIASRLADNAVVLEFGAGRMALKQFLPKNSTYIPSDIVSRGEGTIVCDLNKYPHPKFPKHTVMVFSGVLEYIIDLPKLIESLSVYKSDIICSYECLHAESEKAYRLEQGWLNALSKESFLKLFINNGYQVVESEKWKNQDIFWFRNNG